MHNGSVNNLTNYLTNYCTCHEEWCNPELQLLQDSEHNQVRAENNWYIHQRDHQRIEFCFESAARMVNHHKQYYFINKTMRAEIEFICQALKGNYWSIFEVPIAFIIPRTPSAFLFRDSSLHN